ncbi:MAG: DUF3991 and toprim domain-containing protein [Coriobacteriales bacterium]|jgi:hypothetical protein|nr:DUF3991 and toprim domain-containing protein [Coriobacteriales bacterium]
MPYIDPKEIERVKQIDALSYLKQCEPDELVKLGPNSYCTKTHDSLKLSNGCWFWWSRGVGGKSALDLLIKVREMTFLDAVAKLGAREIEAPRQRAQQPASTAPRAKKLILPSPARSNDAVIAYLKSRGIDTHIINQCVRDGLIYQTEKGTATNAVFVGKDTTGCPRYAALRGITGDYKGEAPGSDKRFSFHLASRDGFATLHVFEGAIDALSFATLALGAGRDWRDFDLLSLGGIPPAAERSGQPRLPQALAQYLSDNPETKRVCLCLDNDGPGFAAADMIAAALVSKGLNVSIVPPREGKDYNSYLLSRLKSRARTPLQKRGREGR